MMRKEICRRRVVMIFAAVLAGLAAVAAAPPAQAHDHRVPQTVLKKGPLDLQRGLKVFESSWNYPSGAQCVNESALYAYRSPKVDQVAAGSALRVRIFKTQRPDSFTVTAYRGVDENNAPTGEGRRLRKTLEPVVRRGERIAWDARFYAVEPSRDYYLLTEGHWRDRQGCGGDQFAFWSFHVKTEG